jgi:glycosyltransferase involved in cell wall biosynthesis
MIGNQENHKLRVAVLRSNPIAPDPRVEKILTALNGAGYDVMALGWDRTGSLPEAEICHNSQVTRLPIRAKFGSGMSNFPALLRWQVGLVRWLARHRDQFDLIHACDFDTILSALYCKLRWKKKVIYDIFDFYADHLRRTPNWVKSMIRRLDLWAINRADAVILVDDSRREQIRGSQPKKLEIIYNSPPDAVLTADGVDSQPRSSKLNITYVGLLQRERGLFEMLDVVLRHPEWRLDFAGFGGDEEEIAAQARMMPNVRWHGRIDYQKALALSRQADVLFATYDPGIANHRYSSPNKIFEAMMLAKPIIVARGTNMDRIVLKANCGIVVEYGDKDELETALMKLSREADLRERLGRNGRRAYDETFSWAIMEKRLLALYHSILDTAPGGNPTNTAGG